MAWLLCVGIGGGGAVQFRNVWCDDDKFNETDIQKYSEACGGVIISATKVNNDKRPNYDCWNCQKILSQGSHGGFCCKPCRDEFFKTMFALEIGQSKVKLDEACSKLEDLLWQFQGNRSEGTDQHLIFCAGLSDVERACSFLAKMGKLKEINGQTYEIIQEKLK
jgi:hypothetical protein